MGTRDGERGQARVYREEAAKHAGSSLPPLSERGSGRRPLAHVWADSPAGRGRAEPQFLTRETTKSKSQLRHSLWHLSSNAEAVLCRESLENASKAGHFSKQWQED